MNKKIPGLQKFTLNSIPKYTLIKKKKNIVSSIISRYMCRATVAVVVIREVCLLVKLNETYLHVYLLYDSFSPGTVAVCDVTI